MQEALRNAELACLDAEELKVVESLLEKAMRGIWEEEPSGDPRGTAWRRWPESWRRSTEKSFAVFRSSNGKQGRRATVAEDCTIDFQLLTCRKVEKGKGKDKGKPMIVPVRRRDPETQELTHPPEGELHPWFEKRVSLHDREDDWLTNDFFWEAFCRCCEKAGRKVTAKPADLFDFQYNRDYRDWSGQEKEVRGGIGYSLPKGWKRFACRVKGKFGSDNSWLRLDGGPGEWAIAYHGTSYEALVPILDGGLKAGSAQAFKGNKDTRTGEVIGTGVYCSPSMLVAERYAGSRGGSGGTDIGDHSVFFVLQCRVNPAKIKRCHDEEKSAFTDHSPYWVLNNPDDIRPYGILVREA
jgi:hypothetical protein